jgi:hypothetical protein
MSTEQRTAIDLYKHARREYEAMRRRLDNYDGNNPNKFVAATRSALRMYELRRDSLSFVGVLLADAEREYEAEREAERQRWATGGGSS